MQLRSLSASALKSYESCPDRFFAEQSHKGADTTNDAALIGSACHDALEMFVQDCHYQDPEPEGRVEMLHKCLDKVWPNYFSNLKHRPEARKMLRDWALATDLYEGREILSTEVKKNFELQTTAGPIPFNYIFDRLDQLPNGDIEVVDYKTTRLPLAPEDLKHMTQARCYAVAAQIEYPDAERIWVTFDQLRHGRVSVVFTREENREMYTHLKEMAQRIIDDTEHKPQMNSECMFCPKKYTCEILLANADKGGLHAVAADPFDAADQLERITGARKALEYAERDVKEAILAHLENADAAELVDDEKGLKVSMAFRKYRSVDPVDALEILGSDLYARHSKINITTLDHLKDSGILEPEQEAALEAATRRAPGSPSLKVTRL